MSEELWLEFLKEQRFDLYQQAKYRIDSHVSEIKRLQLELEKAKLFVENYQNIIAFNGIPLHCQ